MGSCTAGGAYVPAMSDETVIVRNQGTIFLAGPPLVKAATGEVISAEELGGADTHGRKSGVVDHVAENDEHALHDRARHRRAPEHARKTRRPRPARAARRRKFDAEELYGIIPDDVRAPYDVHEVIAPHRRRHRVPRVQGALRHARWSAASRASGACRSRSSPTTACCSRESALKGAHFIELACQRRIPLLFLQNISGFMVGGKYEAAASPSTAPSWSPPSPPPSVPKITVLIGGSFGAGNYGMCGRAYSPALPVHLAQRRISVMGGEQAAIVLATVHRDADSWTPEEAEAFKAPIRQKYEDEGNPYYATARLWDDGIIDPAQTRDVLGLAFSATLNAPIPERAALRRVPDVRRA